MKRFEVALFDLDGTVIDTESQYSLFWSKAGKMYHPEIESFADVIKGTTLKQIFERYFPDEEIQRKLTEGLDEWEREMKYTYVPGVREFIADIRSNGVKCAVVTSSNSKKIDCVKHALPELFGMFDKILTAEMFSASKPDPACYLLGAEVFGADKDNCVVFEDAFTGLQAGMGAGMYTVGLATTNPREAIADKCSVVFDDFTGLSYARVEELMNS